MAPIHPNAAKIECAHRRAWKLLTDYNQKILTFHSIYDYFALLKAFNTNTLNFHQYFKGKLSSHQPSHIHNTPKMLFVPSNSHMEQPTKIALKLHFQVDIQKTNWKPPQGIPILAMSKLSPNLSNVLIINVDSSKLIIDVYMSPYLVFLLILDFFFFPISYAAPYGLESNVTQLLANLLTKPSVFYYLQIASCNLVSIKLLLLSWSGLFRLGFWAGPLLISVVCMWGGGGKSMRHGILHSESVRQCIICPNYINSIIICFCFFVFG